MMQTSPSAGETPEVDKWDQVLQHVKAIQQLLDADMLVCVLRHKKPGSDEMTVNVVDWPAHERYNEKAQMMAPAVKQIFARAKLERDAEVEAAERLAIFKKPS